jgi:lactoylglutathione lyase
MENKSNMIGLRTIIYKVPDIQKAKEWYIKAFGKEPYFDQSFYVGFNIGGFELGLQPEENPINSRADNVETYWGVKDIQIEYDRLIQLGAVENEKPTNVGGQLITATVKDPWANIIGLIYNPDFRIQE